MTFGDATVKGATLVIRLRRSSMPLFSICGVEDEKIHKAVERAYPKDHIKVWPGFWFVVDEATTQQVSDKLRISDGSLGQVVVNAVTSYWGYGPKNLWEWLSVKLK